MLYIHNDYYLPSGEEHAAEALVSMLQEKGHKVIWYRRGSAELDNIFIGSLRAPFLSIYNPAAVRAVRNMIRKENPDIVQIQNIYPLISQGVIKAIKNEGVPLVMRCPNYRIFCPTGLFYDPKGNICEKCTGRGHELWCIRKNCMHYRGKSAGYAFRNFIARTTDVFRKYVDSFIVQSDFQRIKFIELGIPEERISVLPGTAPQVIEIVSEPKPGNLVSFIGRVSHEKGIDDFLAVAAKMPDVRFAVAGAVSNDGKLKHSPVNIEWKGFLSGDELDELYKSSAVIVVPSKCFEGFPNVIARAMNHSKPVIATNLGGMAEIVKHGVNGLLYAPGDIDALLSCIRQILSDPYKSTIMGIRGKEKAEREYSKEVIYSKLMKIYSRTLVSCNHVV